MSEGGSGFANCTFSALFEYTSFHRSSSPLQRGFLQKGHRKWSLQSRVVRPRQRCRELDVGTHPCTYEKPEKRCYEICQGHSGSEYMHFYRATLLCVSGVLNVVRCSQCCASLTATIGCLNSTPIAVAMISHWASSSTASVSGSTQCQNLG